MLGDVLELVPGVIAAVDKYKEAKSDRESRGVARGLKGEAALYTQFIAKVLLLAGTSSIRDADLHQKVTAKLNVERTALLITNLKEMKRLLGALEADFGNLSRSTVCIEPCSQQETSAENETESPS
jgi:hypothetical protein